MRVCILTCTTCKQTADTRVFKEARTLRQAGYSVQIIGCLDANTAPYEEIDGLEIYRVDTSLQLKFRRITFLTRSVVFLWSGILLLLNKLYNIGYFAYYLRSFALIRKQPADIFHAHDLSTLPVAWRARVLTRGKLIYDCHEVWLDRNRIPKRSRVNRAFIWCVERFLSHRADAVLATSESHARMLTKYYHVKPTVIYNASYCQNIEPTNLLRETLAIPSSKKILLYVGYITYGRGLEKLVQSLKYLNQEHSLVFMGYSDPGYLNSLKELIDREKQTDRVYFFGPVQFEQVVKYAASANVGLAAIEDCCLSYRYCFPNKVLEYIAAGLPIAASNLPDIRSVIEKYQIGATFDPSSPRDIARAIDYVLSDKDRYEEMRRNAVEASKVYNWENESKKLLAIYERLASKPSQLSVQAMERGHS